MPTRDRGVARHEGGHALLMLALGQTVKIVTVVPAGGLLGHAQLGLGAGGDENEAGAGELSGWDMLGALVVACAVAIAGPTADLIGGRRPDGQDEGGPAADMIWELTGAEPRTWMPTLCEAVRTYMTGNWASVERIAGALLQRGTLGDADLRALVGAVPRLDLRPVMENIWFHHVRARARMRAAS